MLLGWLKMKRKLCYSLLALVSCTLPAQTADDDELPDMALLEYLAELVEVDGELVGPMDMAEEDELTDTDTNEQTKPQPKQPIKRQQEDIK